MDMFFSLFLGLKVPNISEMIQSSFNYAVNLALETEVSIQDSIEVLNLRDAFQRHLWQFKRDFLTGTFCLDNQDFCLVIDFL